MSELNPINKVTLNSTEWKIRIEGRLLTGEAEEVEDDNKRFLNYFEKIRVEF